MLDIRTEKAQEQDLAAIKAINEKFAHEYSHRESYLREQIAAGRVLVARSNDQVVGYLIHELIWGNTPFLALIRVPREFRGKGIGGSLMRELESRLRVNSYKTLISSSEASNPSGNEFHIKMGFRKIGALPLIYGDENFYRKEL